MTCASYSSGVCLVITYIVAVSTVVSAFAPQVLTFRTSKQSRYIATNPDQQHKSRLSFPLNQLFMSASAAMPDGPSDWEKERRSKQQQQQENSPESVTNFIPLESNPPSPQRLSRMEKEANAKSKFLHGDELIEIRKYIKNLELDLQFAREKRDNNRIKDLTQALHESRNLDAEYVYTYSMEMAEASESEEEAKEWKMEADEARKCLPHFNLQGLWVGK